jgi:orotidine-5'-phosphate decarboxylase
LPEKPFTERLKEINQKRHAYVSVGLDIDLGRMPDGIAADAAGAETFVRTIIEATAEHAAAYKPNVAFFFSLGVAGFDLLSRLHTFMPPGTLLVGDGKWGDIGNTAERYANMAFDEFHFDAVTVNPYMGIDAIEPFLSEPSRGAFVLCRTSNPSSPELQGDGEDAIFLRVAALATTWNRRGNCGLVVGATHPGDLGLVRETAPDLPLLIPGIGAQGGDLEACLGELTRRPPAGLLINSSRGILYASPNSDYSFHSAAAATQLNQTIQQLI